MRRPGAAGIQGKNWQLVLRSLGREHVLDPVGFGQDNNPTFAHRQSSAAIEIEVVANFGSWRYGNSLVDDGPPNLGVAADIHP